MRRSVSSRKKDGTHEDHEESDERFHSPTRNTSRRETRQKSVPSREEEPIIVVDEDDETAVLDTSRASSTSSLKRKRERPPTTGDPSKGIPCDYHVKLARQAKEAEQEEERRERDRCDPAVKPAETMAKKS